MQASYRFVVTGRVQGVGFRYSTVREARRLGLSGWVRNCDDGSVAGHAQGAAVPLDEFHRWLHRGPPTAAVTVVEWCSAPDAVVRGFESR